MMTASDKRLERANKRYKSITCTIDSDEETVKEFRASIDECREATGAVLQEAKERNEQVQKLIERLIVDAKGITQEIANLQAVFDEQKKALTRWRLADKDVEEMAWQSFCDERNVMMALVEKATRTRE